MFRTTNPSPTRDVVRGLHYQIKQPQGKLIRCLSGEIYDVAVDLRRNSPTFCKWVAETLSAANRKMLWIPPGFAHGFMVLSDGAEVLYKATDFCAPQHERTILWNDPTLQIAWPHKDRAILSVKDLAGSTLDHAAVYENWAAQKHHSPHSGSTQPGTQLQRKSGWVPHHQPRKSSPQTVTR